MAQLKSIRLRLDKPLTGPYDRLLRRPGPEVARTGSGRNNGDHPWHAVAKSHAVMGKRGRVLLR